MMSSICDLAVRGQAVRVFASYAHEDRKHRDEFDKFLAPLKDDGRVAVWTDEAIPPGGRWRKEIYDALAAADIIVFLVTKDFLNSRFCKEVELTHALEREREGTVRIVPIFVDHCLWSASPLSELQFLPDDGKAVVDRRQRTKAWAAIAQKIEEMLPPKRSEPQPPRPANPTPYLEWLRDQHSSLDIRGMGAQVAESLPLDRVYTRLSVTTPLLTADEDVHDAGSPLRRRRQHRVRKSNNGVATEHLELPDAAEERTLELRDVLPIVPHLALIGDPGSGKTTFLRFVAQRLARAQLGEAGMLDDLGLTGNAPFPIFVRLSDVARFLTAHPRAELPDDRPEHLFRFLDQAHDGLHLDLPTDFLRQRLFAGHCALLLDGLDEVPGAGMRERMVRLIQQVVAHGTPRDNRHLITCRTRAYHGRTQFVAGVKAVPLAPFGEEEVEQFVTSWARALKRVAPGMPDDAPAVREALAYAESLRGAIDENPSGDTFTKNPLMLTVLAVVHWNRKRLPEQRAELYEAAVEYLLESRKDHTPIEVPTRRECLQAVALRMFADTEGVQRTLGRRDAARAVQELLGGTLESAEEFVESEELNSGLLVSRTEGEVEFWHLTFQEYMAARELSPLTDDRWQVIAPPRLHDDRWAELLLLLAGCERRAGVREARRMIQRILDTGTDTVARAKAVGLVGRILRDIKPYGLDASQGTNVEQHAHALLPIFELGAAPVDERLRVEVGDTLGFIGDPRLRDPEANRVLIPGGTYWMGAQSTDPDGRNFDPDAEDDEAPVHQVAVLPFRISRFLATVQEFASFIDAGEHGYSNPQNWTPEGWTQHANMEWRERWIRDALRRGPNLPVYGVSWYEADAYARWVRGRLPMEAEWEWVARATTARRYPWGDAQPSDLTANFGSRVRRPTPVGIYPMDRLDRPVRDLAGNVWEWCQDWYREYATGTDEKSVGSQKGSSRVRRGGFFDGKARYLRSAFRSQGPPELMGESVGFRVVWR